MIPVDFLMAGGAERDQIVLAVGSQLASRFDVMDLDSGQ
jgi:hypothetical protein